jgi:hypothetical protein
VGALSLQSEKYALTRLKVQNVMNSSLLLKAMCDVGREKEGFVESFYLLLGSYGLQKEGVGGILSVHDVCFDFFPD